MQYSFKRYEKKYLITSQQAATIETALSERMTPDRFDTYLVQNLYFDTDDWDVIHTSMQRPYYKEKMRLRYYGEAGPAGHMFLELKKKYAGVVYKRRLALPSGAFSAPLADVLAREDTQIAREFRFYLQSTKVRERMFIAYRRRAFSGIEDEGLRVTIDSDIRYRARQLHFDASGAGQLVLPETHRLMEIKTHASTPLWLARLCSDNGVFASPYSKYATCYTDYTRRERAGEMVKAYA